MRRTLGLLALFLVATVVAAPAGGAAPEGPPPTITPATLSGPVTPLDGYSGHPPVVAAPGEGSGTTVTPSDGVPVGAESIIGTDDRDRVTPTTNYPSSAVGQIEFDQDGGDYLCTGYLIDDNSILTSGHCAYDPFTGTQPNPIESATFAPGRDRNLDPFGTCDVATVWAPDAWIEDGLMAYDFAVMNLTAGCDDIGQSTGVFGLFSRTGQLADVRSTVQGYPGEATFGTMKRMQGRITVSTKRLIYYPMDTTGGQSGSPLWKQRSSGVCTGPCGLGVHGYGTDPSGTNITKNNNAAVRLTAYRIGQIQDIALQND